MSTFKSWKFMSRHVQSNLNEGQFISSQSVALMIGPPTLTQGSAAVQGDVAGDGASDRSGEVVWPLGLVSSWGINQSLESIRVPEAGSMMKYTLTGGSNGSLQLARSLYHGPSLLRAMNAPHLAYKDDELVMDPLISVDQALQVNPFTKVTELPGYGNFHINLMSEVFRRQVGLLFYMMDSNSEVYAAFYLEGVQLANHGISSGPGQLIVSEQMSASFTRARPIKMDNQIPLFSSAIDPGSVITAEHPNGIHMPTATNL